MINSFVFVENLDKDLQDFVFFSLRSLWTQSSNAIEGNTFTLGETAFFLKEGLTIAGKTLQEHLDIRGYSDAIEKIFDMVSPSRILKKEDLFFLHKIVQRESIVDIYKPVGKWKNENNGTYILDDEGKSAWHEYPSYIDTPRFMDQWLEQFSQLHPTSKDEAIVAYAESHLSFVSIHPFYDGNGRMARLLSNFPVLQSGFPPIIISNKSRQDYITICSNFQKNGKIFPEKMRQVMNSDLQQICQRV